MDCLWPWSFYLAQLAWYSTNSKVQTGPGSSRGAELVECVHIKKGLTRVSYDWEGLGGPIPSVSKPERLRTLAPQSVKPCSLAVPVWCWCWRAADFLESPWSSVHTRAWHQRTMATATEKDTFISRNCRQATSAAASLDLLIYHPPDRCHPLCGGGSSKLILPGNALTLPCLLACSRPNQIDNQD